MDYVILVVVLAVIGAVVFHKKSVKKDGRSIVHRYSGGRAGSVDMSKRLH